MQSAALGLAVLVAIFVADKTPENYADEKHQGSHRPRANANRRGEKKWWNDYPATGNEHLAVCHRGALYGIPHFSAS